MATAALYYRHPRAAAILRRYRRAPAEQLTELGQIVRFALTTVGLIPFALRHYWKELVRMVAQMGMGTGAMAVVGGTAAIVGFITLSAG
ncbi:MAG TPA: ABC transporter permease, partial [Mycobacterium sp.]|nr:ABC transporter permease [Mycobacterium sp.]